MAFMLPVMALSLVDLKTVREFHLLWATFNVRADENIYKVVSCKVQQYARYLYVILTLRYVDARHWSSKTTSGRRL